MSAIDWRPAERIHFEAWVYVAILQVRMSI